MRRTSIFARRAAPMSLRRLFTVAFFSLPALLALSCSDSGDNIGGEHDAAPDQRGDREMDVAREGSDADGAVVGVHNTAWDATANVVAERRMRGDVGKAARAEQSRYHSIDDGPVDPVCMLASGIDPPRFVVLDAERDRAFIRAAARIGDTQRDTILAVDDGRRQHKLAALCRQGWEGRWISRALAPLVPYDWSRPTPRALAQARIKNDVGRTRRRMPAPGGLRARMPAAAGQCCPPGRSRRSRPSSVRVRA